MKACVLTIMLWLALGAISLGEPYKPPIYDILIPTEIRLTEGGSLPLIAEENAVTIEEAVQLGLARNENITEARASVAQATARVSQSRAPFRPTVSFSASQQEPLYFNTAQDGGLALTGFPGLSGLGGFNFNQAPKGPQESLTIRQLLFDFNQTRSSVKAAQANTRAAEASLSQVRQELAFEIRRSYLDLIQSERLAEVQILTAENQAIHISEAQKLLDVGIGLPVDVVRAQTEYARAVREYTSQRNQALLDRIKLASLMGIDPRTPFGIIAPEIEMDVTPGMDELVNRALLQRPGLARSEAEVQAQEYSLENAKASNNPRFTASLSGQANQVTPQPRTESVALMLNFEWPLYDGGLSKAKAREAEAGILSAQARLSRLQRQIVEEVSSAFVRFQTAAQNLVSSDIEVKGAEESQRVATGRYKLGLGNFLEVLDAEQALFAARTGRVNSLTQLEQAEAQLRFAIGEELFK